MTIPPSIPPSIDLNCDLGEYPSAAAADAQLLALVSSANIACGGHAGDEQTMTRTVRAAIALGVAIGAHPGYPDRANFGRIAMPLSPDEIVQTVSEQVGALGMILRAFGHELTHVKPHGALYHAAMHEPSVATAIARGVRTWSGSLIVVGQAASPALEVWRDLGFPTASEGFADRRYEPDGTLRSRSLPGALIESLEEAATQAQRLALGTGIPTSSGSELRVKPRTICIHSDTPNAPAVARAVREKLLGAGCRIAPLGS